MNRTVARINPQFRFMGFFKKAPPLHFYLIQFFCFAYIIYRFASRDYTIYGDLPAEAFDYPFNFRNELSPIPFGYVFTLQFIYDLFDVTPSAQLLAGFQYIIICSCFIGLFGVLPRFNAIIALVLATHITGIMQSADAPIDGGTIALSALFVLSISPSRSFYGLKNGYLLNRPQSTDFHWPITLLFLLVGCFYTFSGIAKLVDVGPHWPFVLHLEKLAYFNLEQEFFLSSRYSHGEMSLAHTNHVLSIVGGIITLIGEVFFITILTHPRKRLFLVFSMIFLHMLVFFTGGINFLGSSIVLLLCFDYNRLQRSACIYYDGNCNFCIKTLKKITGLDWFKLIHLSTIAEIPAGSDEFNKELLTKAMGLKDENGEIYYGADAFEQVFLRIPLLLPFGILMQIPGVVYLSRYIYKLVAINRMYLGCSIDRKTVPNKK